MQIHLLYEAPHIFADQPRLVIGARGQMRFQPNVLVEQRKIGKPMVSGAHRFCRSHPSHQRIIRQKGSGLICLAEVVSNRRLLLFDCHTLKNQIMQIWMDAPIEEDPWIFHDFSKCCGLLRRERVPLTKDNPE